MSGLANYKIDCPNQELDTCMLSCGVIVVWHENVHICCFTAFLIRIRIRQHKIELPVWPMRCAIGHRTGWCSTRKLFVYGSPIRRLLLQWTFDILFCAGAEDLRFFPQYLEKLTVPGRQNLIVQIQVNFQGKHFPLQVRQSECYHFQEWLLQQDGEGASAV